MPQISIIIPIYKAESHLCRCIDSILAQSFTDFELILINDGSPDNCGVICNTYALRDARIRVIHQANSGVSAARNNGLNAAQGTYIMFCDSDDFVDPEWCQQLFSAAHSHPSSWISCNVCVVEINGDKRIKKVTPQNAPKLQETSFYELYSASLCGSPCNKIYRRDIIENHHLRFNENYQIGEDVAFNMQYHHYCPNIIFLSDPLYYYCQDESSAINKYKYNSFDLYRHTFFDRLPYIESQFIDEYLDNWLWRFISMLDDATEPRSPLTTFQKFQYCHKMMNTEEFRYCVDCAPGKRESRLFMKVVRTHNYYIYWLFQKVCNIKAKFLPK